MRRPTKRRWVPWLNGVRRTTSHSTSTRPRSWWWITGDRAENTHPSPSTRHLWSGWAALSSSAFTSQRISHVCSHRCSAEEGTPAPLLPKTTEEVWNEPQFPQILLHLHCGEHPDRLHHRLVWKQHRWQPQSSAKRRANCPPHCWRWASFPLGHLHQAVYKESPEDHQGLQPPVPQSALSAALRETSPQHPIPH